MATPFLEDAADNCDRKRRYNDEFCAARVLVENTIGIWKWRWRVLRDGTGFHNMEKVSKCINGLAALHNFIIKNEKEEMTAEEIKNYRDAVYNEDDPKSTLWVPPHVHLEQHTPDIATNQKILDTYYRE